MGLFILRRVGVMILTALCLTFIVFFLTNLYPNLEKLAKSEGNARMTDSEVESLLLREGYLEPLPVKYGQWLGVLPGHRFEVREATAEEPAIYTGRCFEGRADISTVEASPTFCGVLQGDWGYSTVFREDVGSIVATRLALTGKLMFWVMVLMVPSALLVGVLAGMREGTKLDRSLSTFSIATTATPEYVSGVLFIAIFSSSAVGLKWFKGTATSAMDDANFENFFLPVLTIALYGMGYIARMTRASMTEVMTAQYIRTARLKGVAFRDIVIKHALQERAHRALHRHHAAVPLAPERRRDRGDVVQLQGLRLDAGGGGLEQRHRAPARLLRRRRRRGAGDAAHLRHRLRLPQPADPDGMTLPVHVPHGVR